MPAGGRVVATIFIPEGYVTAGDFAKDCGVELVPDAKYEGVLFDLEQTLRAVLHFWGPEGANKVTTHVMMARKSRDTNAEIDELEKAFNLEPQ